MKKAIQKLTAEIEEYRKDPQRVDRNPYKPKTDRGRRLPRRLTLEQIDGDNHDDGGM